LTIDVDFSERQLAITVPLKLLDFVLKNMETCYPNHNFQINGANIFVSSDQSSIKNNLSLYSGDAPYERKRRLDSLS